MIELCTVKRMIMLVVSLAIICIIFLGVENALTRDVQKMPMSSENLTERDLCWKLENYSIKEECKMCNNFEKVSRHLPVCLVTGFKELIVCERSGEVYRSCPRLPWLDKRNFWLFEAVTFVVGLVSWCVVFLREKQLKHRMLERIQKQIAAGV